MLKSNTVARVYHETPSQPKIEGVLGYSINNQGDKPFTFLGRTIDVGSTFFLDTVGTHTELDLSQLKFSGRSNTNNKAHVLYQVLEVIPKKSTCS